MSLGSVILLKVVPCSLHSHFSPGEGSQEGLMECLGILRDENLDSWSLSKTVCGFSLHVLTRNWWELCVQNWSFVDGDRWFTALVHLSLLLNKKIKANICSGSKVVPDHCKYLGGGGEIQTKYKEENRNYPQYCPQWFMNPFVYCLPVFFFFFFFYVYNKSHKQTCLCQYIHVHYAKMR